MFVKVARFKNDIIPTNIENGDLLNYSSFEEIQREGQETDVRLSMTLLRNAIISCSWKAKRLNDIQDGLEEETISGKVDDLSDIWKILYTLDKGRVEISSYTYFCKNWWSGLFSLDVFCSVRTQMRQVIVYITVIQLILRDNNV